MEKQALTYTANCSGYMIVYKGKNIGGAGIGNGVTYKGRGKARIKDFEENRNSALREIAALKEGRGAQHLRDNIKRVEEGTL